MGYSKFLRKWIRLDVMRWLSPENQAIHKTPLLDRHYSNASSRIPQHIFLNLEIR
jgi:hypothetical protein